MAGIESNFRGIMPLETPLINAAGLINGPESTRVLEDIETLSDTPIGGLTVGSWTIPRREGNAAEFGEPVDHFDPATGEMTNSLGLPNVGIDEGETLVEDILSIADRKPVIFSVSPTLGEGLDSSVEQSIELINRSFAAGAKLVELNVSCPNVVTDSGDRKPIMGHDSESMKELLEALYDQPDHREFGERLGIKLPPYLSIDEIRVQKYIAKTVLDMPIGFITTSNTIPGSKPVDKNGKPILKVPGGVGGSSGPARRMEGRLQLATWKDETKGVLPILSTLGVPDGEEVAVREELGAYASGMNTRLWRSSNWKKTIAEVLSEYAEHQTDEELNGQFTY